MNDNDNHDDDDDDDDGDSSTQNNNNRRHEKLLDKIVVPRARGRVAYVIMFLCVYVEYNRFAFKRVFPLFIAFDNIKRTA